MDMETIGASQYLRLESLKLQLERAVDMGWNWILPFSKALLWLLNWLYSVVRNYGVAIISLATLVRLVLHPLNVVGRTQASSVMPPRSSRTTVMMPARPPWPFGFPC